MIRQPHRLKTPDSGRRTLDFSRDRGAVYLAVLGASMIVTILGVAGLYAVNLQAKISVNANNAMRAELAASSGIEYARAVMRTSDSWRNSLRNDTWTGDVPFDGGTLAFKLVDERDGNLSNNSSDPVRLYAKAVHGKALRIQSVVLQPAGSGLMLPVAGTWRQEVLP